MPQVAVLLETSHGVSRAMLQGIFDYVRVCGPWSLNVIEGGANDQRLPDTRLWKGDGIIARVPNTAVAKAILSSRLPAVLFNPSDTYLNPAHPLSRYSRIQFDSEAIGTLAAEFFLSRTPRRIAFVGAASDNNWSRWRQEAFTRRLETAGVPCSVYPQPPPDQREWIVERPRLRRWLKQLPKPAALFAANDSRARQVIDACLISGIAVPYELTVLGVNNDPLICETCIPPLSSIAVDDERAGYEAASLLDRIMKGDEQPGRVIRHSPREVVERTTTTDLHLSDKRVIRALEFIRINAGFNLRVSDVADHLGVTPRWAEECFKQALGHSLHDEIHRTRMATIRQMVANTDRPFSEIATQCGFRSVNHLCKLFKETFTCTMSDLRKTGTRPNEAPRPFPQSGQARHKAARP